MPLVFSAVFSLGLVSVLRRSQRDHQMAPPFFSSRRAGDQPTPQFPNHPDPELHRPCEAVSGAR
jgi:hypothetical protein